MSNDWGQWPPYVSVAERRARARREVARLRKRGERVEPVVIGGRAIAHSFWGRAWCEHLEKFADFANRLERGRSYVRNDAVCHLEIDGGAVRARVMGSELYAVRVEVTPLAGSRWQHLCRIAAGSIDSIVELLAGSLSERVMQAVTDRDGGLFPTPKEIRLHCSCPDMAKLCKHVAAVLYGVGARLDDRPELLFVLRGVDHRQLIASGAGAVTSLATAPGTGSRRIAESDLADVFGIEMATDATAPIEARSDAGATRGARARTVADRSLGAAKAANPRVLPKPRKSAARKHDPSPAAPTSRRERQATRSRQASHPQPASRPAPDGFGAAEVIGLRERLGLSRAELASLLGVSAAAVGLWERARNPLRLQERSRKALEQAARLTPRAARRRLTSA